MQARGDYVSELCNMGFTRQQAQTALLATNNQSVDSAVDWILQNATDEMDVVQDTSSNHDADFLFALKLQEEQYKQDQQQKSQTVTCQLTNRPVPIDNLYIADECSHKFDRDALTRYISEAVITQVTVSCPACRAPLSVRDIKELLPNGPLNPGVASKQATQRISNELTHVLKSSPEKQGYSVAPIRDNLYLWELKFFNFDPKDPLAQDLHKLRKDHILLHIAFPPTYPLNPPFVRVIRPRFAFRTGHVTVGGSICTELLTNKGWTAANTIEAVIVSIRAQFLEGGARLDLSNTKDYSEAEAKDAFNRMVQTHGWH
jgi:ubiquitin-conjugating enzyme E2 Q